MRPLAFGFCVLLWSPLSFAASVESPTLRLDDTVRPTHYTAELTIVPGQDSFSGKVDIDIELTEPKSVIWLNALQLKIAEATVAGGPARIVEGGQGFIGVQADKPVAAGPAKLHFTYTGVLSRKASSGAFQLEERGQWYAYTQFEATDARRALPCFDQPNFKTPWDIALRVKREHRAFANTPEVGEDTVENGMKVVRFATTKPLPTYLVAFAAGPFDIVDLGKDAHGRTPLRIIVPKGKVAEARAAAQEIPPLLKLLEDYFGTPYPFEKLDSLVMPIGNFAMENVGLITYSEDLLLSSSNSDAVSRQRTRAIVIAHEMAHQWFGDLVTTTWWDDIWLNESFASWLETKIVEEWKPEWRMGVEAVDDRLGVMRLDSLKTTRRIRQPIQSDNDIANAFDGITYEKGAAVIRMFEHWIGPENFQRGVQSYMKQNANGNATAAQFLAAISKAAGRDVAPAFSTFLDQAGVPVVNVDLRCGSKPPRLELSQKRYVSIGSPNAEQETWNIPVCVKYDADGKARSACQLLRSAQGEMTLSGARSCPAWVEANDQALGYYRVVYRKDSQEQALAGDIAALSIAEKVSALGDMSALVASGDVSAAQALAMLPRFTDDNAREVVSGTIPIASLAVGHFAPEDLLPKGRDYIRKLYGERARRLGWKARAGDTDEDRLLRRTLVPFVAASGRDPELIEQASRMARDWLKEGSGVDRNLLGPVLQTAAQFGDEALFDQMLAAAKSTSDHGEQPTILRALASFRDPKLARKAMQVVLTSDFDPRQAFYPLIFQPLKNRETADVPFEFVRENWDQLLDKLPHEVGGDYTAVLPEVGMSICDPAMEGQYVSFFEDRVQKYTGAPRTFAQTRETIGNCIAQKKEIGPSVADFLKRQ
jgi:cytosol alanyl aminopeptidase